MWILKKNIITLLLSGCIRPQLNLLTRPFRTLIRILKNINNFISKVYCSLGHLAAHGARVTFYGLVSTLPNKSHLVLPRRWSFFKKHNETWDLVEVTFLKPVIFVTSCFIQLLQWFTKTSAPSIQLQAK